MTLAGVDGCRNGWIVATAAGWPVEQPVEIKFCADFRTVLETTRDCQAVAVDMPIGLPDGDEPRDCDLAARLALGRQRSSIFLAPPRQCLEAKDPREFQAIHRAVRGVGAGLPVWGIVPKMREVNLEFEQDPALQQRVFEFHPELAWRRLAGERELQSKKTAAGILERVALLNECGRWAPASISVEGNPAIDDVLDAIVGISVAQAFRDSEAPMNAKGLRMRIH